MNSKIKWTFCDKCNAFYWELGMCEICWWEVLRTEAEPLGKIKILYEL